MKLLPFTVLGLADRKTEIDARQMRRDGFETGAHIAVFVNPNDAGQVVLDKRDTNFLDAWARSFVTRFLSTSSGRA